MKDGRGSLEDIPVKMVLGSGNELHSIIVTNDEGYAQINATINDSELIRVEVDEDDYYYGAMNELNVVIPLSAQFVFLTVILGLFSIIGIGIVKKIRTDRIASRPVSPEIKEAMGKESELVESRAGEFLEFKLEEVEEISHGVEEATDASSFPDSIPPPPPESVRD